MYVLTQHAKQRMEERGISEETVKKAYDIAKTKVGKTRHVAVYFNSTNEYIAFDTEDFVVISTMHMHQHRIRSHGSGLRAAQAHARHNNTYCVGTA